jgi:dihydrofolate reductase
MPGDDREFRTSKASAAALRHAIATTGAILCGRKLFDLTNGWNGRHPVGAPIVCVTHEPPARWPHPGVTFVSTGIADAVAVAKDLAAGRTVAVASADIARQCLELGLLDAIKVDLVPVLLGEGTPFLAGVGGVVHLDDPDVTRGDGVTHLHYRVRTATGAGTREAVR